MGDDFAAHYELGLERDRLFREGEPRLEFARTMELLDRFLPPAPADVVVLLGPLYHLTEPSQRSAALLEARRILKPGGVIAAVGISRFAAVFDGLWRHLLAVGTKP